MSTQTEKLGLFKYDPVIDKEELFDIQTSLNDNWDKIDAAVGNIAQSDWNQNDETAPDYIKNRTHYESKRLIDYKPNVSITTDDTGFFRVSGGEQKIAIMTGEYYIIILDGVKYELTPNHLYMLGNASLISDEYEDTGEPFCFHNTYETVDYRFKVPGTHSFEYLRFITFIQTLDEKFLPDTVATKEYVTESLGAVLPSVTSDDNGKFLRVVDGVPAWTTVQQAEEVSL